MKKKGADYLFSWIFHGVSDWIFPPRCPVCDGITDEGEKKIHKKCLTALIPVREPLCMKCGRPISSAREEYCRECRRKRHFFVQAKGLFVYKGRIRKSMYRFKYQNRREYAEFYAEYARMRYGDWVRERQIECILPVPMYHKKRQIRGYNQAECFALALGKKMQLPVERERICRKVNTEALKLMNEKERMMSLKGAFTVDSAWFRRTGYHRILLVDDIYTTGSTVDEIAGAMLSEMPDLSIYVLTICSPSDSGII